MPPKKRNESVQKYFKERLFLNTSMMSKTDAIKFANNPKEIKTISMSDEIPICDKSNTSGNETKISPNNMME